MLIPVTAIGRMVEMDAGGGLGEIIVLHGLIYGLVAAGVVIRRSVESGLGNHRLAWAGSLGLVWWLGAGLDSW